MPPLPIQFCVLENRCECEELISRTVADNRLVHDVMIDDSPSSSQGSEPEVERSCEGVGGDSEDEEVVVIHQRDNQSGHTSGDDSEDLDHNCSIVADSDFRLVTS